MALELFLLKNTSEMLSLAMAIGAVFFSYRLTIKDKKITWNLITMGISVFAIGITFSILDKSLQIGVFEFLEHFSMMLAGLVFAGTLLAAEQQKDGLK